MKEIKLVIALLAGLLIGLVVDTHPAEEDWSEEDWSEELSEWEGADEWD